MRAARHKTFVAREGTVVRSDDGPHPWTPGGNTEDETSPEQAVELPPDDAVEAAGGGLEARTVENRPTPAGIADEPHLAEQAGRRTHPGPANAQHLGQELLVQEELVRPHPVMRLEQRAGTPLSH